MKYKNNIMCPNDANQFRIINHAGTNVNMDAQVFT